MLLEALSLLCAGGFWAVTLVDANSPVAGPLGALGLPGQLVLIVRGVRDRLAARRDRLASPRD